MEGIKDAYTTQELASVLCVTPQAIQKRYTRESWQSRPRGGRGGGREWLVASMPEKTRLALALRLRPEPAPEAVTETAVKGLAKASELRGNARTRADAKVALLVRYQAFAATRRMPRLRGLDAFAAQWNERQIEAEPWIYDTIPSVCRNTLLNWEKTAQTEGVARLAGNYGTHRKGTGAIDSQPDLRGLLKGMLYEYPTVSGRLLMDSLKTANSERTDAGKEPLKLPSARTLQHWVARWKEDNPQLYQYILSPDKWRNQFMVSCGSAYELISRYNQRWEFDGTPADLLLADGKRYTIVGVINIYSRELLLEVAERSSALTVAGLVRRAILEWGVPEECVFDNGKEFVSNHVQMVIKGLGVLSTILPPFRPDLKGGIERAFRTFSHHLLTLQHGFVGHNVAERKDIECRKSFAERLFQKHETLELNLTPEALQNFCTDWTNSVYRHRKHSGLKGKLRGMTPWEARQSYSGPVSRLEKGQEDALNVLVMPLASNGGLREVTKKGVRAENTTFFDTALGIHVGKRVYMWIDRSDRGYAYVFSEDHEFICKARNVGELSVDERRDLAVAGRRTQKAAVAAEARAMRDLAARHNVEDMGRRVMESSRREAAVIEALAKPEQSASPYSMPLVEQMSVAAKTGKTRAPRAHDAAIDALRERTRKEFEASEVKDTWTPPAGAHAKYMLHEELCAAVARGERVTDRQREWMRNYGSSNAYYGQKMAHEAYDAPISAAG